MLRPPHATRIDRENAPDRASLRRTAVSATTAFLIASLCLWPVAARAATPTCLGKTATIVGTAGDDEPLPGTSGDDVIVGRGGKDVIQGRGGNDRICGNGGVDTLQGGRGDDRLQGGGGDDTLLSDIGDDRFLGGAGNDVVDYSQAYFTSKSDGLKVNLATGRAKGEGADRLAGVEGVKGSGYGNDVLTASDAGSMLDGGFGADILIGGPSADILRAGATDSDPDTLEGSGGDDTLDFGGSGDDRLTYEHAPSGVHIDLALSTVSGGDGTDVLIGTPAYVVGSKYGDHMIGTDDANYFTGGAGPDTIDGAGYYDYISPGRGDDTVDGGAGSDTVIYSDGTATAGVAVDLQLGTVTGGSGSDTLSGIEDVGGTSFDDVIEGDNEHNSLSGGAGDDTLIGRDGNDFLYGGGGNDTLNGGNDLDTCEGEVTTFCEF
jgi:Ca2+-binding RTX toxin-like protein